MPRLLPLGAGAIGAGSFHPLVDGAPAGRLYGARLRVRRPRRIIIDQGRTPYDQPADGYVKRPALRLKAENGNIIEQRQRNTQLSVKYPRRDGGTGSQSHGG